MTNFQQRYIVPALERGLKVLELFDRQHVELGPPEIAKALKLPRTTVFRLTQTLEGLGFLERNGTAFRLGPAVLRLGFEYLASLELTELARPVIERLRDETNCASQLVIRDGREVVVVLKAPSASMFASNVNIGSRFPAHATILGRTLLCELADDELARLYPERSLKSYSQSTPKSTADLRELLAEDRRRGYLMSEGFFERGICALAAPVRDQSGRIVAAVSLTLQRQSLEPRDLRDRLIDQVRAAAAQISQRLDYRPEKEAA
jgi:DNA-binding IclR family transcriptional regulator